MNTCEMCGFQGKFILYGKYYQYDNGEQFVAQVCGKCLWQHNQLVKGA